MQPKNIHAALDPKALDTITQLYAATASAIRRRQLDDSNKFFLNLSSAGTVLGTCFGAVLQATLWRLWSPVLRRPPTARRGEDWLLQRGTLHATIA